MSAIGCGRRLLFGAYRCGESSRGRVLICDVCSWAGLDTRDITNGAPPNGAPRGGEDTRVSFLPAVADASSPFRAFGQQTSIIVPTRIAPAPSPAPAPHQKQPQQNGSAHGSPSAAPLGEAQCTSCSVVVPRERWCSIAGKPFCVVCIAPETCTGCGAVVLHKDGWAFDEKPFCKPLCADRWARTRNDDDAAPDRVIERESNGPHVAPCSCEESLALRRRLRAAEKLLTDAQKVALALVNYGDEFAVAGALSGGIRSALRALHGEL